MTIKTGETRVAVLIIVTSLSLGLLFAMHPGSQSSRYKNSGQYRKAIEINLGAKNNLLFASDPGIELDLACCFRRTGEIAEARRHLALARELAATHAYLWLFRPHGLQYSLECEEGWIALKSEQYSDALAAFERALELEKSAEAYIGRAAALEIQGRDREALADFAAAIECSTGHDRELAYHERAIFYIDRSRTEEAIADLTSALNADSCNRAYIDRAMLFKKQGDIEKALNDLDASINITGTERAYHERALIRRARREFDEAIKDIDQATLLDSTCPGLKEDRERILAESGKSR
ncbi:MAG: tetratricopeptide repeat protein [Candidatus Melainabacteria bacterium]|nr:tetratricopeptide repeat protein [Candidatus Melainabacteria bacterium]